MTHHRAAALAGALATAHEKSIVHRDLKPANVMVRGDGHLGVLDLGRALETRPCLELLQASHGSEV